MGGVREAGWSARVGKTQKRPLFEKTKKRKNHKKGLTLRENMISCNYKPKGDKNMNKRETDIIREIMNNSTPKVTFDVLRDKMGYKTVSGVSERLKGKSLKVDTFAKFLDALGYELIVQPKTARDAKDGSYKVEVPE